VGEQGARAPVEGLPRLRPAVPADAPAIVRLLQEAGADGMLGIEPGTLRPEAEAARLGRLDLRQACALVVVGSGIVAGYGVAVRGAPPALPHTATVAVAVCPGSRRRGLGRLLLGGLRAWAEAAGVRKLCASVCARNHPALALFHRCGYAVEGLRRDQLLAGGAPADEVLFGLLLAPSAAAPGGTVIPLRQARPEPRP
jgi:L-amino acid N-acyltransferase YncA